MSAERLREAAALMRSRADAAIPGPWTADVLGSEGYAIMAPPIDPESSSNIRHRMRRWVARIGMNDWQVDKDTATHIASWHPAVALAVADWLTYTADTWRSRPVREKGAVFGGDQEQAIAVANAYLGSDQ